MRHIDRPSRIALRAFLAAVLVVAPFTPAVREDAPRQETNAAPADDFLESAVAAPFEWVPGLYTSVSLKAAQADAAPADAALSLEKAFTTDEDRKSVV